MEDMELNEAARGLSNLMTAIDRKLIRPHEQKTRHIVSPLVIHVLTMLTEIETATMTELANEIKIAKAQLTPIIDKLCDSEWVCREHDAADRRIVRIKITPKGVSMLHEMRETLFEFLKEKLSRLEKEDIATLQNALNDLYSVIHKMA